MTEKKVNNDRAPGWLWWMPAGLALVVALGLGWLFKPTEPPPPKKAEKAEAQTQTPYDSLIYQAAGKYGVDANLIKAVIQHESGWDKDAVGTNGEKGLMQLMPATVQRYSVGDPFDPAQNIDGGTHYLSDLLKKYGQAEKALQAYNAGEDAVDKGEIPDSTRDYITQVMSYWETYKSGVAATAVVATQPAAPKTERVVEIIAPVGQWSEYVSIPPLHWFRIWPEAKIRVKTLRGREFELEPGKPKLLGDNLTDATFQFTAYGEQPVAVKIALQSK